MLNRQAHFSSRVPGGNTDGRGINDRPSDNAVVRFVSTRYREALVHRDPYEVAIDRILESADGDIRLALRAVLIQNLQLEARLMALSEKMSTRKDRTNHLKHPLN
jgi:hypothetical protein